MKKYLKETFTLLIPYVWKDKKNIFYFFETLVYIIFGVVGTVYSPILLSKILSFEKVEFYLFLFLALFWIFQNISQYLSFISFYKITNQAIKEIRIKIILTVNNLDDLSLLKFKNSEIIHTAERVPSSIVNFMNSIFFTIPYHIFTIFSSLLSICFFDKLFSFFFLLLSFFSFIISFFLIKKFIKSRFDVWKKGDDVRIFQNEVLQGNFFSRRNKNTIKKILNDKFEKEAKSWTLNNKQDFSILIFYTIFFIFFSCNIFYFLHKKGMKKQDMIAFSSYIILLYNSLLMIITDIKKIITSSIDFAKIIEILNLSKTKNSCFLENKEIINNEFDIICKNLSFGYEKENFINNLSFEIKKNQKVAIIGKSGIGKSTICKILSGDFNFEKGEIFLFGKNIKSLDDSFFEQNIEYVSQDCSLFDFSVQENLFINGENIPDCIYEYFKDKLEYRAGELGKNLSLGERQRILIARSFAKKSKILILDETFSGLDQNSINQILDEIKKKSKTVIVVTHKKDILENFDMILDLDLYLSHS